ncbi:MAG: hypothetical protein U0W24_13140 [Bacteroidales bacterium]
MCISFQAYLSAQELPNSLRIKKLRVQGDTLVTDSLEIVPGSIQVSTISGILLPDNFFKYNYKSIIIVDKNLANDTLQWLTVKYRVFPVQLQKAISNLDTSLILPDFNRKKITRSELPDKNQDFDEDDRLDKSGSISRGISVGNQHDLTSLSNLNLQLSGKINDEISILAAISDNSMPIQPEGSTQQIQEFDKVFIKMYTKKSGITLGDIELNKPEGYYLSLKKQTRGFKLYSNFNPGKTDKFKIYSDLSAGVAKGKYNRLRLQGIEGNQGPYRLTGSNNENYIMVLSGSEKVYIDGQLLERGDKFDYTIDYNSAEITFTSNRPITKDSRITVEFEYAQEYYPRMQVLQTNLIKAGNSTFWLNFYSEQDNKNDPLSDNYNDSTIQFLSEIGDSLKYAIAPGFKTSGFSSDKILYEMVDTLVSGQQYDSVFRYSINPEKAVYQLSFTFLGKNRGNYVQENTNANGKVFKWVAPEGGVSQGSYEPVTIYITPKKSAMVNLGGSIKTGPYGSTSFEVAVSNQDVNTYSSKNNGDDAGFAMKFNIEQGIFNKDTGNFQLKIFASYQAADNKFKPIENYYDVEFERDWNLSPVQPSWQEQKIGTGISLYSKRVGFINLTGDFMMRQNDYTGKKAGFISRLGFKGFRFDSDASFLKSEDSWNKSEYLKYKAVLSKHFKFLTIGISEETEQNLKYSGISDSMSNNAFRFSEHSIFIKQADSSVNQVYANFKQRNDELPYLGRMQQFSEAKTMQAGMNLLKNKFFKLKTIITYRNVDFRDTSGLVQRKTENLLSGRQELNLVLAKGGLNLSLFYETASGLEIEKQFVYVEVPQGQGQFTWIDYNQNEMKELDEFEIARFADEGNFIRLFLPGNESVRVFTTQFNPTVLVQPEKNWSKMKGVKGFLSSFSNQFACRILQKSNTANYLPEFTDHPSQISRFMQVRNNLTYKSKSRKWQFDYLYDNSFNKSLLVNGTDSKNIVENLFKAKWRMGKNLTLFNAYKYGYQRLTSEFFNWKNYNLRQKSNELSLQIQPSEAFFSTLEYKFSSKQNTTGIENSKLNGIKLILNRVFSVKINIQADFSYVNTFINSDANSSVTYEMLEGLKPGKNLIWNLSYNHKLSKIFQLSIGYNGRTSEHSSIIHNGTMQIVANF